MIQFPVIARTYAALKDLVTPKPGYGEAIPYVLYDTATLVTGTTTELTFFTTTRANPQLSNLQPAGALPSDQEFEIAAICLDVLTNPVATAWADVWAILLGPGTAAAPTFTLTIAQKNAGPIPLSMLGPTGGIAGFSDAAAAATQYAVNGGRGWWTDQALVIPPQITFDLTARWAAAPAPAADTLLRVSLVGTLHRSIR